MSEFEMPFDSCTVTVRRLTKQSENGERLCLYHLFAGALEDCEDESDAISATKTWKFRNDDLFNAIKTKAESDLCDPRVSKEKKEMLLRECPHFVVCTSMPGLDDNGIVHLKTLLPCIGVTPDRQELLYEYRHNDDETMSIIVTEPKSPPLATYNGRKTSQRQLREVKKVSCIYF